ncbi:MAG: type VI secretion system tip protein VgrG [Gemmatimonadetes bacterium]|nr:type VI secretion system tip protein VgrG [Gemmatimonadota bacterium]
MAEYTQANRPIKVFTSLDEDVLLLNGFSGLEAISQPYAFQLDLLSTDVDIDAAELLRTPLRIEFAGGGDDTRVVHGLVSRFSQTGRKDDLAFYRAELVPWLWFLNLSRESRIYQELSVPDILEQVFKRAGFSDFEFRLKHEYQKRLFCVQYRESHFAFVSRLLEEEGICYFFEHAEDKHLLVLSDDSSGSEPVLGPEAIDFLPEGHTDEYVVSELECEHRVYPGRMELREYDYLKPTTDLQAKQGEEDEEVYDYPGGYRELDDGDRFARLLLEAQEAERQRVRGVSDAAGLVPGCHFKLQGHYQKGTNTKYLVTQVQHVGNAGSYRAWEGDAPFNYRNNFLAIPHATPFRPRRRTPKPAIHGSQSALVVGKAGEEVWTDSHGRIKLHFYWDRDSKRDENSSCWIRVATPWAGKSWGAISIPRIGNEVLVAFEEGEPDRPVVIGSVYNADQTPPFALPGAGIQMGMRTRSSKGGGGMNEITMTDKKGTELVNVHAQFDMVTRVEHDDRQTVGNDRTVNVGGKHTETIKKDTKITITEGTYSHEVVEGTATLHVKGDVSEAYDANQSTVVGKVIHIQAGDKIELITGDSSMTLAKDGTIKIVGKKVSIEGKDEVKVDAPKIAVSGGQEVKAGVGSQLVTWNTAKVSVSGAAINATAVGTHEIAGAVVKIN